MARFGSTARSALALGLIAAHAAAQTAPAAKPKDSEEPPASEAPKTPAPAPDVVLLENGGMLRGTISELVPGDYVVLVTVTGEQRKFPMSEVKFAGPASEMPKKEPEPQPPTEAQPQPKSQTKPEEKTKPFATIHSAEARVHFESETPGLTLHRRSASAGATDGGGIAAIAGYDELCAAPCDVSIPSGSYTLALSKGTGATVAADDPVSVPPGGSVVRGTYKDKSGLRTTGWIVMGAGLLVGTYLIVTASEDVEECSSISGCHTTKEYNTTKGSLGLLTSLAGIGVGFALAFQPDSASFTVTPGAPAQPANGAREKLDRLALSNLQGLTVTGHF